MCPRAACVAADGLCSTDCLGRYFLLKLCFVVESFPAMNTQAFGGFGSTQPGGGLGGFGSTQPGPSGLGLGLSFQDFPASQSNYLEFADFSQVKMLDMHPSTCAVHAAARIHGCCHPPTLSRCCWPHREMGMQDWMDCLWSFSR